MSNVTKIWEPNTNDKPKKSNHSYQRKLAMKIDLLRNQN